MEEKESEVTKAVREAVVKAVEKGEDIKEKVVGIARDAVKKALEVPKLRGRTWNPWLKVR